MVGTWRSTDIVNSKGTYGAYMHCILDVLTALQVFCVQDNKMDIYRPQNPLTSVMSSPGTPIAKWAGARIRFHHANYSTHSPLPPPPLVQAAVFEYCGCTSSLLHTAMVDEMPRCCSANGWRDCSECGKQASHM